MDMMLNTESPSTEHASLDQYPAQDLVNVFIDDQQKAILAVRHASAAIARAVNAAVPRIEAGGRLVYVGAGTSGRLGLLDSVELYPTFSWPKERAIALLAGGPRAVHEAIEGAEDSREQGARDVEIANVSANDVVILIAASGGTPYVMGALAAARARGALTVGVANNPQAPVTVEAEIGITLDTGPEVISGSTRLKAGTAQKITLNTFSSALMVRLNKVYGNLMVDVKPTNAKLIRRSVSLTVLATGADEATARKTLEACGYHVKVAIVAIARNINVGQAELRLVDSKGSVRAALAQP
jgi:N-acetylmuramic acid 6-phosphate etherase